jgi:hypothetical protein
MKQSGFIPITVPPAYWSLAYDPGRHLMVLRWHIPCPLLDAMPVYEQLLRLARRHNCARWLLDNRLASPVSATFLAWLVHDYFPRSAARMAPRLLHLAVVTTPVRVAELRQNPVLSPALAVLQAPRRPLDGQYFTNEGAALAWLLAQPD